MSNEPQLIDIGKIGSSDLGFISVAEFPKNIPFEVKRVYWTYYTPNDVLRGGHAHRQLRQLIFAVSGTIVFTIEDTHGQVSKFTLDSPNVGLYLPQKIWREIQFSHSAVLLCLASEVFDEDDYIRDYSDFKSLKE